MSDKLKMEYWKSSDGKAEEHFFLPLGGWAECYMVGFNPAVLSPEARRDILKIVEHDLKRKRTMAHVTPSA